MISGTMNAEPMHPNIARVTQAARQAGHPIEPSRFPEGTRTAVDAARAVGCDVAQIVKSLVFMAGDEPVLALMSGTNRADTAKLAEAVGAVGAVGLRRADAGEVRAATGFAIGGVPPFGHARSIRVVVDRDLLTFTVVWAAAGLPDAAFPIEPAALVAVSGGTVADLAEPASTTAT
jgi:prolyl-tRNA editing enzyme YbaK/EbsC (Cys-tRNA(Pro) deacylase)